MSPAHARLNELTARMDSTHTDFEAEKKARSSVMELKVRNRGAVYCYGRTLSLTLGAPTAVPRHRREDHAQQAL